MPPGRPIESDGLHSGQRGGGRVARRASASPRCERRAADARIRAGADAAIIRALLAHGDRELLVEVQLNRQGANRAQLASGLPDAAR